MFTITALAIIWLGVGFLWWMFFFVYRDYRIDRLRHRLFVIRNDLFLAAARDEIELDHPAYLMIRKTLNGNIRFAHQLSLTSLLTFRLCIGHDMQVIRDEYDKRRENASKDLSPAQIRLLHDYEADMHIAMLSHVLHVSLVLFPMAQVIKLVLKTGALNKLQLESHDTLTNVDALSYKFGDAIAA